MKRDMGILIVEKDPISAEELRKKLSEEGYRVAVAGDGTTALRMAMDFKPRLMILEIELPGIDGFEVCYEMKRSLFTSIIILSERNEVEDRIRGLNLGADDYMGKPYHYLELLARINARLRTNGVEENGPVNFGPFQIDGEGHSISYRNEPLALSITEYKLLKYLVLNNGKVLTKVCIIEAVWGYDFSGGDNIVEVYVRYLRKKLGDKEHKVLCNVRGVGYKIVLE